MGGGTSHSRQRETCFEKTYDASRRTVVEYHGEQWYFPMKTVVVSRSSTKNSGTSTQNSGRTYVGDQYIR